MQTGTQFAKIAKGETTLKNSTHSPKEEPKGAPHSQKWKGGTLFTKVERGHPIHQNSPKCKREYPINQSAKGRPHSPKCKRGPHSRK